jgi:hypothetical protein
MMHGDGDYALNETEALMMTQAICGVFVQFVRPMKLGAKGQALGALLMATGMVYTPKVVGKAARKAAAARAAQAASSGGPTAQPLVIVPGQ